MALLAFPGAGARASGARSAPTGGTAYWAELPGQAPNWIFPFSSSDFATADNEQQFQQLMYRPLYRMTAGGKVGLDRTDSLADPPAYSHGDSVVTIQLKGWKWSNGTVVDAQDVVFFLNMVRAEKANWSGYLAGEMPDNIVSVEAPKADALTVAITFDQSYNTTWLLENELSQITPMPLAWDISKLVDGKPAPPGSGGCSSIRWDATTERHCEAVWAFMTDDNGTSSRPHEAGDLHTYATNPLWKIVDGPWRLANLSDIGRVTMVPNPHYSGPDKPRLAAFVEVPYGTDAAEYAALGSGVLSVGYVPDGTTKSSPLGTGYDIVADYPWGVNYVVVNFDSSGDHGRAARIFRKLYVRQAMQELVDQPAIVTGDYDGGAVENDGPVPSMPATNLVSSEERHNPYPYDPSAAVRLLRTHGWTVEPGGTSICSAMKGCGAGVPAGTRLDLWLAFNPAGADSEVVKSDVAGWSRAGIDVTTVAMSYTETLETATPCTVSEPTCGWEMAYWGGGWDYVPDLYPSGDVLFETGSSGNLGAYSDPENDSLISKSVSTNGPANLLTWENYAAENLPVIWQPEAATVFAVAKDLHGVTPLSPLSALDPEDWYFSG